ncbi:hypothetical protein A9Q98_07745 [Thalassotalea sp. 42_200_T64]|nr:hypothetical protein A9Q98_07745 [Thalassotalea sp. 42_200_T64]
MIVGQWGIILNLLSIAMITIMVTVGAISLLSIIFQERLSLISPTTRKSILWLFVSSPWWMAIVTTLLFYSTFATALGSEALISVAHWHHPDIFEIASWHGVSIALFLIWVTVILVRKLNLLINSKQTQSSLIGFSKEQVQGSSVIDSAVPNAFTCGFFFPKSYVTTGLKAHLNKEELAIVLAHEAAHVKNFDPLKKWVFMLFAAFFPARASGKLKIAMSQAMEQLADSSVVDLGYRNDTVASTLVKVTRISMRFKPESVSIVANSFHAEALEERVKWLLNSHSSTVHFHYLILLLPCLLLLLSMFSVDRLHHLIETILNH